MTLELVRRWCRIYECWREAAEGSDFCRVKHGWWEPEPVIAEPVVVRMPLRGPPVVRDCVGCDQPFEQERRQGKHFSYCETCRGIAA